MLGKAFCWLYEKWLSLALHDEGQPLVRFMNFFFLSKCKYCMATRAMIAGFGAGILFAGWWVTGLLLVFVAWFLTYGERKWICEFEKE